MAQNLNYANGTGISSCYGDVVANCQIYGRLYDWAAVMGELVSADSSVYSDTTDHKGICPEGWHVPKNSEWQALENYVNELNGDADNDESTTDDDVGISLKGSTGWSDNGNGADMYGFSAQPGGEFETGYVYAGYIGIWWTATGFSSTEGHARLLGYSFSELKSGAISKSYRMSLRCLKTM
jgi:uncharacterized protein (TIGR02145 family)